MELKPEEITKIIREQIKNYHTQLETSETGTVVLVGDGIARASGLDQCMAGELIEFPNGSYGMAQNLAEDGRDGVAVVDDEQSERDAEGRTEDADGGADHQESHVSTAVDERLHVGSDGVEGTGLRDIVEERIEEHEHEEHPVHL